MIPVTLNLKNFMSYTNLELDFTEIHVACLSGENGAGKSSILDAITWCLWDQARASTNEDLIRLGEADMSVEMIFRLEESLYRIIRSTRKKGKTKSESSLEFQVLSENGYRSITGKTIKETQARITETVKMDYMTFVNSAFILQGKADEFTTKSPTERKKVLAEILNLKQFDLLQEKSKERLKEIESEKVLISKETEYFNEIIKDEELIKEKLAIDKASLEKSEEKIITIEKEISEIIESREKYNSELSILKQIYKTYLDNKQTLDNVNIDFEKLKQELSQFENIISKKEQIERNYSRLNELKKQNDIFSDKLLKSSEIENSINKISTEINNQKNEIKLELQKLQERAENYNNDKHEHEKIIKDKTKILESYQKLLKAREDESEYQKKFNLSQKLNDKKVQLEKKLQLELHELQVTENSFKTKISEKKLQIESASGIEDKIVDINKQIEALEAKSTYRENIKEKGTKLKSDIEHNKKLIISKQEEIKVYEEKIIQWSEFHEANCPMCTRHLDETERQMIIDKYRQNIQTIEYEIEKLNVDNSLIEKKMEEYRNLYSQLNTEIKGRDLLQKQIGEFEKIIANAKEADLAIKKLSEDLKVILDRLEKNQINYELQNEITLLNKQISDLDYNPEKLSVIQAEINNWKWSELKIEQIKSSEETLNKINDILPKIDNKVNHLKLSIESNSFAKEKEESLSSLYAELKIIDYKKEEHHLLRDEITKIKDYEQYWNSLQKAITRSSGINEELVRLDKTKQKLLNDISENSDKIEKIPEIETKLSTTNQLFNDKNNSHNELRKENNELRVQVSKNTEKLEQFNKFKESMQENQEKQNKLDYEIRLYKELINAFGKNGIQAVIIENAIPEIENAANLLLNRITEGRMNISFNTRKENKTNDKIKETLDIFISDELGTRNYEMYSGGEAFRVNFAIRLALSKVLARRSGTRLKTLVIDEGFGTQDSKGISRLIEAINTVSSDFDKIIIVTHMNELKEAFPTKLEVYKTISGSQVRIFNN